MPGMTESHVHLSYNNAHPQQLNNQPLLAMLDAVENAAHWFGFTRQLALDPQGLDVPLRDAINEEGMWATLTSDRDLGSTGSNADGTFAVMNKKIIADGPWAIRKAVRSLAKRCVSENFLRWGSTRDTPSGFLTYSDEEVDAAVSEHTSRHAVVCHSRSASGEQQCDSGLILTTPTISMKRLL